MRNNADSSCFLDPGRIILDKSGTNLCYKTDQMQKTIHLFGDFTKCLYLCPVKWGNLIWQTYRKDVLRLVFGYHESGKFYTRSKVRQQGRPLGVFASIGFLYPYKKHIGYIYGPVWALGTQKHAEISYWRFGSSLV